MTPVDSLNHLGSKNGSMRPEQKTLAYVLGEQTAFLIQKLPSSLAELGSSARSVREAARKVEYFIRSFFTLLPGADASPQGNRRRVEITEGYVSPDVSRYEFFKETVDILDPEEIDIKVRYVPDKDSLDRLPNPPEAQQGPLEPDEFVYSRPRWG